MAVAKYLKTSNGVLVEQAAINTSAGAGDEGKIPALDAAGRLAANMMPTGFGADVQSIQASENLAAGDYVNVHTVSAAARIRKADATSAGKEADGFVLAAVTSGQNGDVYFEATNNQVTGQTAGGDVFLSTTPGAGTATCPTGTGNVQQRLGKAISTTAVNFERGTPIVLA